MDRIYFSSELGDMVREINERTSFSPTTGDLTAEAVWILKFLDKVAASPPLDEFLKKFHIRIAGDFSPKYPLVVEHPCGSLNLMVGLEEPGLYYCRWTVKEPDDIVCIKVTEEIINGWHPYSQKRLAMTNKSICWKIIRDKIKAIHKGVCG